MFFFIRKWTMLQVGLCVEKKHRRQQPSSQHYYKCLKFVWIILNFFVFINMCILLGFD
ncbi:hypothetical protein OIU77_006234 [Salix suchowensis]|uniref:Uncharacterized protein n=1 Tax=Salix suchowensis TaxID=1278906 RepID=A0ABQ9ALF5_9ROSI|nr:hypothetical protein OIU77_006234 [Salix suchowensis]